MRTLRSISLAGFLCWSLQAGSASAQTTDNGALLYVGPPVPQESLAQVFTLAEARDAGMDVHPAVVGLRVPFPYDADGTCGDTEIQLMGDDTHPGAGRSRVIVEVTNDLEAQSCFVDVVKNTRIDKVPPQTPAELLARAGGSYFGEWWRGAWIQATLKKKNSLGYAEASRAKTRLGLRWWDHMAFPGAAVYGGERNYAKYSVCTKCGWYFGEPFPLIEEWDLPGPDYVGGIASAGVLQPQLGYGASGGGYILAGPGGSMRWKCFWHPRKIYDRRGRLRYKWFCDKRKYIHSVLL